MQRKIAYIVANSAAKLLKINRTTKLPLKLTHNLQRFWKKNARLPLVIGNYWSFFVWIYINNNIRHYLEHCPILWFNSSISIDVKEVQAVFCQSLLNVAHVAVWACHANPLWASTSVCCVSLGCLWIPKALVGIRAFVSIAAVSLFASRFIFVDGNLMHVGREIAKVHLCGGGEIFLFHYLLRGILEVPK